MFVGTRQRDCIFLQQHVTCLNILLDEKIVLYFFYYYLAMLGVLL